MKDVSKNLLRYACYLLDLLFMRIIIRSTFLCRFYYGFIDSSFAGEMKAVVAGKLAYRKRIVCGDSYYALRRNTHKLEKGLIMRPRRDLFALDYISETVDCYERALAHKHVQRRSLELRWAGDVLDEYFRVIASHPLVDAQRIRFSRLRNERAENNSVPNKRSSYLHNKIPTYAQLLSLAQLRRSVRWYNDKKVDRSDIDAALKIALLSPSACNRQPFRFHFFTSREMIEKVGGLPAGTAGWGSNIPVLAVVVGELGAYCYERDRHTMFIDASLAVMSFAFALETRGLSSCIINWVDIPTKEKEMGRLLNLSMDQRPLMCIALGHADASGLVPYSEKLPLSEARRYY